MNGVAEYMMELPGVTQELHRVSQALSGERRAIAGDRVRIDLALKGHEKLEGKVGALETKVDAQHAIVTNELSELKGWVKWAMGAVAAGTAILGFLIHRH